MEKGREPNEVQEMRNEKEGWQWKGQEVSHAVCILKIFLLETTNWKKENFFFKVQCDNPHVERLIRCR